MHSQLENELARRPPLLACKHQFPTVLHLPMPAAISAIKASPTFTTTSSRSHTSVAHISTHLHVTAGLHCNEAVKCSEMCKDKCSISTTRNRQRRHRLRQRLSQWPKLRRRKRHKDNALRKSVDCGKLCGHCHCCGFGHSVCCCNKAVSGHTSKLLWILGLLLPLPLPLPKYALCTQQLKQTLRDSLGGSVGCRVGPSTGWLPRVVACNSCCCFAYCFATDTCKFTTISLLNMFVGIGECMRKFILTHTMTFVLALTPSHVDIPLLTEVIIGK